MPDGRAVEITFDAIKNGINAMMVLK